VFANTDFMTDGLQDLNLRSVVGGGIGYHLINRDNATLNLLGGANFKRENYVEVQRNLAAGQVGEEFTLKLGKSIVLLQNLAFFPDLTDSGGNYRTNFSLRTVTKIGKWLGWQNNFSDTYVTNPPAGKTRTSSCSRPACTWHSLADNNARACERENSRLVLVPRCTARRLEKFPIILVSSRLHTEPPLPGKVSLRRMKCGGSKGQ
jgi:hypothetical protein